jgi:hypothetical protein
MSELLLLDPYRSALIARAFDELLLQVPPDLNIQGAPLFKIGRDRKFQDSVLQMALLFDDLLVVYHKDTADNYPLPTLSLQALADEGVLNFAAAPTEFDRSAPNASTIEGLWQAADANFRLWAPLIVPMLTAKGFFPHSSLVYLLRAKRLGLATTRLAQAVPYRFTRERDNILTGNISRSLHDGSVFFAINEALQAKILVNERLCRVAHTAPAARVEYPLR